MICQLKAVYIKVMSLRRPAIRRFLPFLCLLRETQTERLLGRLLKCLSGRNFNWFVQSFAVESGHRLLPQSRPTVVRMFSHTGDHIKCLSEVLQRLACPLCL